MNENAQVPAEYPAELDAFATTRGRPCICLFLEEPLDVDHLLNVESELGEQKFESIDLVIQSVGGNIHVAYQIIELLRLQSTQVNACVPLYAKSAATLLCLGADEIVVDRLAELGPLDTQISERKKGGQTSFTSALNPFKTLAQLQEFALQNLDTAVTLITRRSPLDLEDSIRHAIDFARVTTEPMFSRLNPEKLGEYSRALAVGSEYGHRLLRRYSKWDRDKRTSVMEKLVHGYPSHEYIINYHELKELGFNVSLFSSEERSLISSVAHQVMESRGTLIGLILPSDYLSDASSTVAKDKETNTQLARQKRK